MRFRFALEPLKRVAHVREKCEERKLQAVQVTVAEIAGKIEQVVEAQVTARRAAASENCCEMAWRQAAQREIAMLEGQERRLRERMANAQKQLTQQQAAYVLARQKAEAMNRLRANAYEIFQREVQRREQSAMDDVFLNRYR